MIKKYDCKGLACPKPVLVAKDAIESHPEAIIEITVDNEASRQNVERFFKSQGWIVEIKQESPNSFVLAAKGGCFTPSAQNSKDATAAATGSTTAATPEKILVLIPSETMGTGDDTLGRLLMKNFIATLKEMDNVLWRIVFVNAGVKLAIHEAETIEHLKALEASGVSILVCGTCLNHFGILEQKAVGETTNMLDIITSLQLASKVVRV